MNKSRTIAFCGVMTAFALILSYLESLFPLPIGIPGIKLGLANLVVFLMLYLVEWKSALAVNLIRILIAGFAFNGMYSLLYSLCGGMLSFLGMALLKKTGKFAPVTVSICGGVLHNIGKLLMAGLVLENAAVAVYSPVLLTAGVVCGALIGLLGEFLRDRIEHIIAGSGRSGLE